MFSNDFIKLIFIICSVVLHVSPLNATQITIVNLDGANEGFNDNTPVLSVGGNTGTTIGSQRLQVFEYAARVWETIIDGNVEIKVEANFDPLTCTSSSAVLGAAGTTALFRDFPNVPLALTLYPVALANNIAGSDLTLLPDIRAIFNSDVDNNDNCLNNTNWYYGLDGNKPFNSVELLQVVMHEIAHGLGFQTFVDITTGQKFGTPGRNDVYMLNLEDHSLGQTWDQLTNNQRLASVTDTTDLHWVGSNVTTKIGDYTSGVNQGHVQQYAPASLATGSSVSHFDSVLTPDELMEPFITSSSKGPGLAIQLMQDIGWQLFSNFSPIIGKLSDVNMAGLNTETQFVIGDNDTALTSLIFSFASSNITLIDSPGLSVAGEEALRTLIITPNTGVTGTATITVNVSDGTTTVSESFILTVTNSKPTIVIDSPADGTSYTLTDQITFQATATDAEDGLISENTQWTSSIDGVLGTGSIVNAVLSVGTHNIVASIIDSGGVTSSVNITVNVYGDLDNDGMNDLWELTNFGTLDRNGSGDFDGDGISDLDEYLISISKPDGDLNIDGIVNVLDILIAQQILNGQLVPTPLQLAHGDVAPLVGGVPAPDGQYNIADMLVLMRKVAGIISY